MHPEVIVLPAAVVVLFLLWAGFHRLVWDLRINDPVQIPGAFYSGPTPRGPLVTPGRYTPTDDVLSSAAAARQVSRATSATRTIRRSSPKGRTPR